jgi:hypothetical protein
MWTYCSNIIGIVLPIILAEAAATDQQVLFDFGPGFDVKTCSDQRCEGHRSQCARKGIKRNARRRYHKPADRDGGTEAWPGVTLKAPAGKWDLSPFESISLDVANRGDKRVTVSCRVDNPGADGTNHCVTEQVALDPGASQTLTVRLFPVPWKLDQPLELVGMRGFPTHAGKLDTANVTQLLIFADHPKRTMSLRLTNPRRGHVQVLDASTFRRSSDEFGQYLHKGLAGQDAFGRGADRPQPRGRRRTCRPTGGRRTGRVARRLDGGQQLATWGFFGMREAQRQMARDPTGRLFWSHGIDCVRASDSTPITGREKYFRELPAEGSPFARFYGQAAWAPH